MTKKIVSLNGNWLFKKDKLNQGEKNNWYQDKLEGKVVEVPAAWQSYSQELYNYCGFAWYNKNFDLIKEKNRRYFIRFKAVDYQAELYCNGESLGSHCGGYTPFEFEITSQLKSGKNMVHLKVYDPEDNDEIPHGKQGSWYSRVSGIWQDVNLISCPETFIKRVEYQTDFDHKTVAFRVDIDRPDLLQNAGLQLEIFSPKNKDKVIKSKTFGLKDKLEFKFNKIQDWSPVSPALYDYRITLKDGENTVDYHDDYFAFRKIEIRENEFYLNNQPLYIRGALDQAFWSNSRYKLDNKEQIEAEIKKVKELGFNLLRKHIKIADPNYLEAADRMGLLIWEEPPNYAKWTLEARELFKEEYTEMIRRDKKHPSIIIWSIYNEEWGLEWDLANDEEKQQWLAEFYDYAKKLDPTRLICDNSGWAHVKTDINDIHRYFAVPEDAQAWQKDLDDYVIGSPEKNYVRPELHNDEVKVVSEFGMWGLPEPSKIEKRYQEMPQWYNNSSKLFDEDFKVPITAEHNFNKYQLDRIFSDLDELALATQKRESEGMKYLIEEIRKRREISGYVVTELSDIEWETNGFLDFFREEKPAFDYDLSYNQEIMISSGLEKRNISASEPLVVDPLIINDSNKEIMGELYFQIDQEKERKIEDITIENNSILQPGEKSISFASPAEPVVKTLKLKLYLNNKEAQIVDRVEIRIYPESNAESEKGISLEVRVENKEFKNNLINNGYQLCNKGADLIVSDYLDQKLLSRVKAGARLLFMAESGSQIAKKSHFNFLYQKSGESWDKAASFNFFAAGEYPELPFNKINNWELDSIYPEYYLKNFNDLGSYQMQAGSFKAWLGDFVLSLVEIEKGKGKIMLTTFKLLNNYGDKIQAVYLLDSLINKFVKG